jgi:hypothetical protein
MRAALYDQRRVEGLRNRLGGLTIETALTVLGLATPVFLFALVMRNALDVPVGDEWSWVLLL